MYLFYFLGRIMQGYRNRTATVIWSVKDVMYKLIVLLLVSTVVIWLSIFLYATFYYSYMPSVSHVRPVHLQFKSCGKEMGICSFPSAKVALTKKQQLLMVGQSYRITLDVEMPESPANEKLGMFMVCMNLKDRTGNIVDSSCRSAMLHYKSSLLRTISTIVLTPFLLSGSAEEKQLVNVELFSGFEEDPGRPVTDIDIELQTHFIEVYSTSLRIHAHFTGLRYFMFHWPVISAMIGISTNLSFLSLVIILSWYRFYPHETVIKMDFNRPKSVGEQERVFKERRVQRGRIVSGNKIEEMYYEPSDQGSSLQTAEMPPSQSKEELTVKEKDTTKEEEKSSTEGGELRYRGTGKEALGVSV